MYLVSECATMSKPCSIGLSSAGVATVLSTMVAIPRERAMSAMAARSTMLPAGLPMLSQNTALVRSSISAARSSAPSPSAKRTSIPREGSVWANSV